MKCVSKIDLNDSDQYSFELLNTKCEKFNISVKEVFDKIYSFCHENEFDKYLDDQSLTEKDLNEIWLKV